MCGPRFTLCRTKFTCSTYLHSYRHPHTVTIRELDSRLHATYTYNSLPRSWRLIYPHTQSRSLAVLASTLEPVPVHFVLSTAAIQCRADSFCAHLLQARSPSSSAGTATFKSLLSQRQTMDTQSTTYRNLFVLQNCSSGTLLLGNRYTNGRGQHVSSAHALCW